MLLNGSSDSTDMDSSVETNEILESDDLRIAGRVAELEKKVLEQGEELMYLKSTLAEVLKRLALFEGSKSKLSSTDVSATASSKESFRLRTTDFSPTHGTEKNTARLSSVEPARRLYSSCLPQRRAVHYQSTGSLHSDSQSSSSVSPSPSPSPSIPSSTKKVMLMRQSPGNRNNLNGSQLHKRWSSTGDFKATSPLGLQSKFSNKSLLNLYSKSHQLSNSLKHGTKDLIFNEEFNCLTMYLKGIPINLYSPSDLSDNFKLTKVTTAPHQRLKLDWVYGYRGKDCRSNLYSLPTGEIIYFVACVVVLYNVEEQCQRHYVGHTDEVKSLAIHPNKMLIATGQCGNHEKRDSMPHVRIWNSISLHTQAIIGMNYFEVSVCCLSFSKSDGGSYLVAIDDVTDHIISVWDWQKGENGYRITETKCSVDTIISVDFHPLERDVLVTAGKSHIAFWSLDVNGVLHRRIGSFESRYKPKYITSIAFLQTGETISGDSNGNLAVWGRGTNTILKISKNVHDGAIFSICVTRDGSFLTGGGKDGRIIKFDSKIQRLGYDNQIEGHFGGIRVISEGWKNQILIGTTKNCILCGSCEKGFQPIILGHTDELWGLASHPCLPHFVTAGHDRVLQLWDSMSHSILWSKDIGEQVHSLCFSPNGTYIFAGCCSGRWMVFHSQTRNMLWSTNDGTEIITVIQFSPNGKMFALGSNDNNIYMYQVADQGLKYNRIGRCSGHTSPICFLDWSEDNTILRSNSADHEVLHWNASTCRHITQVSDFRDKRWATNNCTVTFNTVGIWPENADGGNINCCDCSLDLELLVAGDDLGKVKIYNYPVSQPKSLCHVYGGHGSHITGVRFLHQDANIVSIGGKDTAVFQWRII